MAKSGSTTTIDVASLPAKPAKRFTPEQRIQAVEKVRAAAARGVKMIDACKAAGITDATYYVWRKNNGRDKKKAGKKAKKLNGRATSMAPGATVQITLLIQGQPLTVSLEDAIQIQQGLGQILRFQR